LILVGLSFALGSEVTARPRVGSDGRPQGWIGFAQCADLLNQHEEVIGRYGFGGDKVRGRVCAELHGSGCEQVVEWVEVVRLLENVNARITRCDLCADFLEGEVSVDTALAAFRNGDFAAGGKPPSGRLVDDLGSGAGRTLYVGSRESSRMARIYEKGRQLGCRASPWVRVEVELKNRRYVIPFGVLLAPVEYLAGCYPVFEVWLQSATASMRAIRRKATISVQKAVLVAKQQTGAVVAFLATRMNWSSSRIVRHLIGRDVSKRVEVSKFCERLIEPHQGFAELIAERWSDELVGGAV
jgi:phage replication initiation protein